MFLMALINLPFFLVFFVILKDDRVVDILFPFAIIGM